MVKIFTSDKIVTVLDTSGNVTVYRNLKELDKLFAMTPVLDSTGTQYCKYDLYDLLNKVGEFYVHSEDASGKINPDWKFKIQIH